MRKNDSDSRRTRTSSGGGPRSSGAGRRDGKPKTGGGFKPRSEGRPERTFGERAEGSFERKPQFGRSAGRKEFSAGRRFEQRPGTDRGERRTAEPGTGRAGGFGERRSTDWSTGGYRITKKGAGKGTGDFKGFKKDDEAAAGGFRGSRRGAEPRSEGFRGPRRGAEPRNEGFRGPRRDTEPRNEGFRGPRRDAEPRNEGFRGPRRDAEPRREGFRGPRRDDEPRREGFRGPRRDTEPRSEGFRGPRRDAEPRAAGFKGKRSFGSKRGFEGKATGAAISKKFESKLNKEDVITKKEALRDYVDDDSADREDRVEGRNPVFEALRSGRPLNKLFVEKDNEDTMISRIVAMAREKNIPIQYMERKKLDMMSQARIHQGVILDVAAQEYVEVEDILAKAEEKGEKPFVLVLDEITDTNNLGSIIRSAECSGVHGIVIPKRRSATLNATVAKVAAGALEYVPVARVSNLVQTLRELKEEGLWVVGADMEGESNYYDADLTGPCALVIGSEGEGLSRLVKDECDLMVRIPMKGKISSLNAGVAAALIMFEISKQRG